MVASTRCSVPSFMHASRMARISACAVGSCVWATLLALSARISPSLTITVANGRPPSTTFWRARSIVRWAKSVTGRRVMQKELAISPVVVTRLSIFSRSGRGNTMARTDRDRWDLATSVGATATMVAAQRALSSDQNLIDDPYAAPLVRAVGIDVYVRLVNGQIPVGGDSEFNPQRMARGMACRTRFSDQFFLEAANSGVGEGGIVA